MEDLKNLEFLASNSKEIIEKQVDSYRQQHSYAGTIIGVTILFIPFFLSSLDGSFPATQFISIVPIVLFIVAMLLLLSIFRSRPLDQAFSVEKYHVYLDKTYKEVLVNEINSNVHSYNINVLITQKANKRYSLGVNLTTFALLIAIVLLLTNQFIRIAKKPHQSPGSEYHKAQLIYPGMSNL